VINFLQKSPGIEDEIQQMKETIIHGVEAAIDQQILSSLLRGLTCGLATSDFCGRCPQNFWVGLTKSDTT
jgi:hypothetical protein